MHSSLRTNFSMQARLSIHKRERARGIQSRKIVCCAGYQWEIFQDNFDMSEIVPIGEALDLINTQCPVLSSLGDTYAVWGAQQAKDKTYHRSLVLESLGVPE